MCRKDLLAVLLLCVVISFPVTVVGDCYDDLADNNKSYNNCATCYQTFANALVNTADNKYRLSRAFFPVHFAPPVEVEVSYESKTPGLKSRHFFWLTGGFYVFQPVYIFLYRSLYFSAPKYRRKGVIITLPDSCFDNSSTEDFFDYATQRLKGYARSQSAQLHIDDSYMGKSVNKDSEIKYYLGDGKKIILAAYGIPFCFTFVILLIMFYLVLHASLDELETLIKGSPLFQANVIAAMFLCVIITAYTIIFDIRSWYIEQKLYDLPTYYDQEKPFVNMMNAFFILYFIFLSFGIVWFLFEIIVRKCRKCQSQISSTTDGESKTVMYLNKFRMKSAHDQLKKNNKRLALVCMLISGSTLLSLSAHFPSILMAWATNPFYASRIALYYIFSIAAYYTTFHYTYIFSSKAFGKIEGRDVIFTKKAWILVPLSLIFSFMLVTGVIVTITIFVISVPVSNSIETTSEGVTSIYNGAVILIGGLLAYKIGWYYLGNSFSVTEALQKALKKVERPPFRVDRENDWENITEEGRLAEVMRAIVKSEGLRDIFKIPECTPDQVGGP